MQEKGRWKCKRGLPHIFRLPQHLIGCQRGNIQWIEEDSFYFHLFTTKQHFNFTTQSKVTPVSHWYLKTLEDHLLGGLIHYSEMVFL